MLSRVSLFFFELLPLRDCVPLEMSVFILMSLREMFPRSLRMSSSIVGFLLFEAHFVTEKRARCSRRSACAPIDRVSGALSAYMVEWLSLLVLCFLME